MQFSINSAKSLGHMARLGGEHQFISRPNADINGVWEDRFISQRLKSDCSIT